MLIPIYTKSFKKDLKKSQKRGKNINKLKDIIELLLKEIELPAKNRNHKLKGNFTGKWECHIEPDWLLLYEIKGPEIIFIRTGTHSDFLE